MASGQDIAKANTAKFEAWIMEHYHADDWPSYVRGGKLNRSEIARECGFAKSVFGQNPKVKEALAAVERDLTKRGILRPGGNEAAADRQASAAISRLRQRLNQLEQQNHELRAQLDEAKETLRRYALMDEFLQKTGRCPR